MRRFVGRIAKAALPAWVVAWLRKKIDPSSVRPVLPFVERRVVYANEMRFEVVCDRGNTDYFFWNQFVSGEWEPTTFAFFRNYVRPDKEVIDIGGWIGPTMFIAYSCNPAKIHLVEADPANYQILRMNCRNNALDGKVFIENVCIHEKTGDIVGFGYNYEDKCGKTCKDSSSNSIKGDRVRVGTVTLLDYLKTKDLSKVNIIKIDIEGAETLCAAGFDYLSEQKDIVVNLSLHPPFWRDREKATETLASELKKFDIFDVSGKPIPLSTVKAMMLDDRTESVWKTNGVFFSVILKTRNR